MQNNALTPASFPLSAKFAPLAGIGGPRTLPFVIGARPDRRAPASWGASSEKTPRIFLSYVECFELTPTQPRGTNKHRGMAGLRGRIRIRGGKSAAPQSIANPAAAPGSQSTPAVSSGGTFKRYLGMACAAGRGTRCALSFCHTS
jgi:hypothetical protein